MELQKPVDRRFKSDHPHTIILVLLTLALTASAVIPGAATTVTGATTESSSTGVSSSTSQYVTCLNGNGPPLVQSTTRVALVQPVFTSTPYTDYNFGSYYAFYHRYQQANGNITSDLRWLNTSTSIAAGYNFGWGHSYPLFVFMTSEEAGDCGLSMGKNEAVLSDVNVTQGALFNLDGTPRFDVAVVGFSEYVTQQEYLQFKQFVASGGRLVLASADTFQVQVLYNSSSGFERYVTGHGFAYNGRTAWRTHSHPFDLTNFIGSTDCCFRNGAYAGALVNGNNAFGAALSSVFGDVVFKSYVAHEENSVTNRTDTAVVATFSNVPGILVASYVHQYKEGLVACLCVFGDDMISIDTSAQYFVLFAVGAQVSGLVSEVTWSSWTSLLLEGSVVALVVATATLVFFMSGRRKTVQG